jgi:hypothetical protein
VIPPIPTEWWFRPVSRAWRVGEQRAVVWKRLYLSPFAASLSAVGGDRAAECARRSEPDVVDEDDQNVWGTLWRPQLLNRREGGTWVLRVIRREPDRRHVRDRQNVAVQLRPLGHGVPPDSL